MKLDEAFHEFMNDETKGFKSDPNINFPALEMRCFKAGWEYQELTTKEIANESIKNQLELKAKLDIAREALEFYASEDNWNDCWVDGCPGSDEYFTTIKDDMGSRVGGFRARKALEKLRS